MRQAWRLVVLAGAAGLVTVGGARFIADSRVREAIKSSPVLRRINSSSLRQVDAWIFNLRHDTPGVAELGDGQAPQAIRLGDPMGVVGGADGVVYVGDRGGTGPGHVVWAIDGHTARVVAGTGGRGIARTGGPARESALGSPQGLALDPEGRVYFADSYNHLVLRIERDGRLSRVAGVGRPGDEGDGGSATRAALNQPYDVRFANDGSLYIADYGNNRIRRVSPDGRISTVAGTGRPGYAGDGGPATLALLHGPYGVYPDVRYGLLIADSQNHVVRRVAPDGRIETIAGSGRPGNSGDGGPALEARFDTPQSLAVDDARRIYVGDEHNHQLRLIDTTGIVRRLAGVGKAGFSPDGTPADSAELSDPENMVFLSDGRLLLTEAGNGRVRLIDSDHRLVTFAGRAR